MKIWDDQGRPYRRAALITAAVFIVLLVIGWQATAWYEGLLLTEQRAEAAVELSLRGNVLSATLNRRFARLQALAAFAQGQTEIENFDQAFAGFAAIVYEGAVGVRSFALAPEGTVRYVYPRQGNEELLGYQPLSDERAEVRADVRRAMRTGAIVLSLPETADDLALSAYQALYQAGDFWGLVRLEIDVAVLLNEAGLTDPESALGYALRDGTGHIIFGDPALFAQDPVINVIELPEGTWELAGAPGGGWEATLQPMLSIFRVVGFSIVLLLSILAFLTVNRQARLQAAVTERTRQIAQANRLLEQRVQERTRELETLLDISRTVSATLELQPLLELLLEQLHAVIDYAAAAVYFLEKEEGETVLHLVHYRGPIAQEILEERWPSQRRPLATAPHQEKVIRQEPVLIEDVRADTPLAAAYRETMAYLGDQIAYSRSWMGVPLRVRERTIGMLAFDHAQPAFYSKRDVDLASAFAAQAAIAIENARLYADARSLAVLQERQRLARELHDSVSQALYGISLGTLTTRRLLEQEKIAEAVTPLAYTHTLAEAALTEMRALIFELRPESLEGEGLAAALEKQAEAVRTRHNIGVQTELCQEPRAPLAVREAFYRVAQEALNNIVKHAEADSVTLQLLCAEDRLALTIRDTGRGFDTSTHFPGHLGLKSMRERMEQIGGSFSVNSTPGAGTIVRAEAPLDGTT